MLENLILLCAVVMIPMTIIGYLATWKGNKNEKEMAAYMTKTAKMV